jgi:hypothetical protein
MLKVCLDAADSRQLLRHLTKPATIEQFRNLCHGKGLPEIEKPQRLRQDSSLLADSEEMK